MFLLFSLFPQVNAAQDDNYFIVTAYYSPLPNQEYYITGNYEDELILNGKGIAGASGKGVFSGMLAAPSKYGFGTKIYLDGLGIGSVEDRGGAIVPAGERGYSYDRIDVWMGYGDEGLLRANFWGKRKVYGYIIDPVNSTSFDYSQVPAPEWATTGLKKVTHSPIIKTQDFNKSVDELNIFNISLGKGSEAAYINKMQDIFITLGYLDSASGEYDDTTISAVYDFQIEHKIVSSEQDIGAGSYGPKTREKLKEIYENYIIKKEKQEKLAREMSDIQEKLQDKAEQYIESLNIPSYGEISYEVRELQKILSQLGYFEYKDTAIFGDITKSAIITYQIDSEIIFSDIEIGSGIFGPKTREKIIEDLSNSYFHEYLNENNLQAVYQEYIESTLKI